MLFHKTLECAPRKVLRDRMKYANLMPHGLASFSCPNPSPNDSNQEESMPCALSTKIQPDSRGTRPGNVHRMRVSYCAGKFAKPSIPSRCGDQFALAALLTNSDRKRTLSKRYVASSRYLFLLLRNIFCGLQTLVAPALIASMKFESTSGT